MRWTTLAAQHPRFHAQIRAKLTVNAQTVRMVMRAALIGTMIHKSGSLTNVNPSSVQTVRIRVQVAADALLSKRAHPLGMIYLTSGWGALPTTLASLDHRQLSPAVCLLM